MNKIFFETAKLQIESAAKEASNLSNLNHKYLEGKIKEIALNKILSPFLPNQFGIGTGKLCDSKSFLSKEIDLLMYSKRLIPPKIIDTNFGLFPIESVLTCIEIKSQLNQRELKKTFNNFQDIIRNASINTGFFGHKDQNVKSAQGFSHNGDFCL